MDDDTRKLLDDLDEGDKIQVGISGRPDIKGDYCGLTREDDGTWRLIVMTSRKKSPYSHISTEIIEQISLVRRTSSS